MLNHNTNNNKRRVIGMIVCLIEFIEELNK